MFREMKNIDTAFRQTRMFSLVVVLATIALAIVVVFKSFAWVREQSSKIHVLYNGKLLEALAVDRKVNLPLEIRDHVKDFHYYFFTLSPDEKSIQKNIRKALYLADGSAKQLYDDLKEKGYYSAIISGNVSQQIEVDSVALNLNSTPYYFRCFAKQLVTRTTSVVTRNLISEGYIRMGLEKSDDNQHGFLIERLSIVENKDLEVKQR
jgi:conjugative transposon TraK protein